MSCVLVQFLAETKQNILICITLFKSIKTINRKFYTIIRDLPTLGENIFCELNATFREIFVISEDRARFICSFSRPKPTTVPVKFDLVG